MSISNTIASRCRKAGDRFHASDNISDHIKDIKVSRISYGIPIGGELEYVDGNTIARAIQGRTEVNVD